MCVCVCVCVLKKNIYIFYLSHLVHSFLTIMPQVLINIALNVFPCNAPREIPPCMAYMAGDHTPSTSKQRRTPRLGSEKASMQGGIAS